MTYILFALWSLTCVGLGIALTFWVASALAARTENDDDDSDEPTEPPPDPPSTIFCYRIVAVRPADPLAEYETVDAPEHAPSVN